MNNIEVVIAPPMLQYSPDAGECYRLSFTKPRGWENFILHVSHIPWKEGSYSVWASDPQQRRILGTVTRNLTLLDG